MNSNEAFAKEDELDLTERRIEISVDDPGEPENPPENLTRNDGQTETQNDQNYSTQIASEPVIFVENEMNRPTTVRFDVGTDEPDRPDFKIRKASTVDQLASTITGISANNSNNNTRPARNWTYSLLGSCCTHPRLIPITTAFCPVHTEYKLARVTSNNQKAKTIMWMFITFWVACFLTLVLLFAPFRNDLSGFFKYLLLSLFIFAMLFTTVHRLLTIFRFRVTIRYFFNIQGSVARDLVQVFLCRYCVLCQIMSELEHQKSMRGSVGNFHISVHKYEHNQDPNQN
ncbi:uncharacterized protein LOC142342969 [Convolutriloba macropyga]|uniref:uncharacterized protein LOC142342969 n=1 Tax=Convolutriloba macropyga TaxID=536237 RepID=UPI003F523ED7